MVIEETAREQIAVVEEMVAMDERQKISGIVDARTEMREEAVIASTNPCWPNR
jgi:hypothetical protein